jgi:energy-converting hydrogenase Eha subunit G
MTYEMFAHTFRFDQVHSRMRHAFAPRKPRHRLLRVLMGVIGLALLVVLVMFGLFVGAAMIATGLLFRLWKQRGKSARNARSQVLDGEYRVVDRLSLR